MGIALGRDGPAHRAVNILDAGHLEIRGQFGAVKLQAGPEILFKHVVAGIQGKIQVSLNLGHLLVQAEFQTEIIDGL